MRIAAYVLAGCALAGCTTPPPAPPPPAPAAPVERSLDERLARAADELLETALDHERWPHTRVRVALRLDAREGVTPELRRALAPGMLAGLRARVAVLAERGDARVLDEVLTEQHGPAYEKTPAQAGGRWRATHVVRGVASKHAGAPGSPPRWRIDWRLLDLRTGEIAALTHTELSVPALLEAQRAERPPADVDTGDALALTEAILDAGARGDGATLVALLHPDLRRAWTRRAQQRRQTLRAYATSHLARGTLRSLGPVRSMELKPGRVRCEVEVEFARKHRDVDFRYRLHQGGWRLCDLDDYP